VLEIKILSDFHQELADTLRYIRDELQAPMAARRLETEVRKAINKLRDFPFAHRQFVSQTPLKIAYRIVTVKNYYIFYSIDDFIKIHHIYYKGRDFSKLIK
jgi:plasmid stabilization system protein ParE